MASRAGRSRVGDHASSKVPPRRRRLPYKVTTALRTLPTGEAPDDHLFPPLRPSPPATALLLAALVLKPPPSPLPLTVPLHQQSHRTGRRPFPYRIPHTVTRGWSPLAPLPTDRTVRSEHDHRGCATGQAARSRARTPLRHHLQARSSTARPTTFTCRLSPLAALTQWFAVRF